MISAAIPSSFDYGTGHFDKGAFPQFRNGTLEKKLPEIHFLTRKIHLKRIFY